MSDLKATVHGLMGQARHDLATLVGFQSVASSEPEHVAGCASAAQALAGLLQAAGLKDAKLYDTPSPDQTVAYKSKAAFGSAPAPEGKPTVLLYCHYDVQPADYKDAWKLVEKDGRWYARGSADCKGNIVAHLTALRALGNGHFPVGVKLVAEGSEEQGDGGLETFVTRHKDMFQSDAILVCDTGNAAVGRPTLTTTLRGIVTLDVTVKTLRTSVHSGMFGGAAPDALQALVQMLATLHDERGNTTIDKLTNNQQWSGEPYPAPRFRTDATVLDDVDLLGDGSVADMVWARPSLTVIAIDCPRTHDPPPRSAIPETATARLSLRVPPGTRATDALEALQDHLLMRAPWHAQVTMKPGAPNEPFVGSTEGRAYDTLRTAMQDAFDHTPLASVGQGGSIPLCNVFKESFPSAEIMLLGVEEPKCLIHAENESVDPSEIEHIALAEAMFLTSYANATSQKPT